MHPLPQPGLFEVASVKIDRENFYFFKELKRTVFSVEIYLHNYLDFSANISGFFFMNLILLLNLVSFEDI